MESISQGAELPYFQTTDHHGNAFDSTELLGAPAVIYFYPFNWSPHCTAQACAFRDAYKEFIKYGARVVGISSDTSKQHIKFIHQFDLPFTLLSDSSGRIRETFGVGTAFMGMLSRRETFTFNKEGILVHKFYSQFNTKEHIQTAIWALRNQV